MIKIIHRMIRMADVTYILPKFILNHQLVLVLFLTVLFDLSLLLLGYATLRAIRP